MSLLLAAIVAATVAASPVSEQFDAGETLDYNLRWLKITGGTARMTIRPVSGDESLLRITSVGKSSPGFSRIFRVRDEIETTVAREDFSTVRYVKRLDEQGDKHEEVTIIDDGIATRTRRKVKRVRVPRPVFDPISLIYHLRTVDLGVGKAYDFVVIADGKVYNVHARVTKKEKVQTPAGTFDTVLVEPRMESGGVEREEKLYIWYSDDERRVPVRIRTDVKFGSITATLRGVANGVTSIDPPVLKGE